MTSHLLKIKNSKVARAPIQVPGDINVTIGDKAITVSGKKGKLELMKSDLVNVEYNDGKEPKEIQVTPKSASKESRALSGTYAALVKNMIQGVNQGFEKTLKLIGVGYRAKISGNKLELTIGYSHPVIYIIPEGITIDMPDQTTLIIKGMDKQRVGQVSAEIRSYREPENYKGKGIRYADEEIIIKETKK